MAGLFVSSGKQEKTKMFSDLPSYVLEKIELQGWKRDSDDRYYFLSQVGHSVFMPVTL